jgi:hypothetical protein
MPCALTKGELLGAVAAQSRLSQSAIVGLWMILSGMASEMFSKTTEYPRYSARQRLALLAIELIVGVGSVIGGLGLATGWIEASDGYLKDAPVDSYVLPGLFLAIVIGGASLAAAFLVASRSYLALPFSFLTGFLLLGWIALQIYYIGLINWLQPAMGAAGIAIACIAVAASRRQ